MKKRSIIKRGFLLLFIGLSVFLIYLYFLGGVTGFANIASTLRRANLLYYSLAFASIILGTLFYSLTWHRLLSLLSIRSAFRKTFLYIWVGTFVDLLVPAEAITGEITRAYLMSRSLSGDTGKVVASIVSHRLLSMAITLGGLILSSAFFVLKYKPAGLIVNFIMVVSVGTAASIILLYYLFSRKKVTEKVVNWLISFLTFVSRGRWHLTGLRSRIQTTLKAFHEGIEILISRPKSLALPTAFSLAAWFFHMLTPFFVFVSIGFHVPLSAIIVVYSISIALQTIPIGVPGEVGLIEIVMTSLYTLLGIPVVISAAATVLTRVITLWFKLFVGYMATQWVGIKVLMGSTS